MSKILVTGGCGFIGSNFLNIMVNKYPKHIFLNIDSLTYAGNPKNIYPKTIASNNYNFVKADIRDKNLINIIISTFQPDIVIHFAAESHVSRSIDNPEIFIETNIIGTYNLLEACKNTWKDLNNKRFVAISTDEVFGETENEEEYFTEKSLYKPSTPYAASKAASDFLVKTYGRTYGLPINITNCSNNYGPNQHKEKLIPRMISLYINNELLTIHGDGLLVRDWLYVEDHCNAIWTVAMNGILGESYNIGGNKYLTVLDIINKICDILYKETRIEYKDRMVFVPNRPGNDFRYAIDYSYIQRTLGWEPTSSFEEKLDFTIKWYLQHHSRLKGN